MQFCGKCDTKLTRTDNGLKCPRCEPEQIIIKKEFEKKNPSGEFPFELNQYYVQKEIRQTLGCNNMSGINFNKAGNFLVVFMNAHSAAKPGQQNNVYFDHYNNETGLYHYVGRGKIGNQNLRGVNGRLAYSKQNNTKIHFFRQYNFGASHKYVGEVTVEKIIEDRQPDKNGKDRMVYVFLLKPNE